VVDKLISIVHSCSARRPAESADDILTVFLEIRKSSGERIALHLRRDDRRRLDNKTKKIIEAQLLRDQRAMAAIMPMK
jgi:hypothetical protein